MTLSCWVLYTSTRAAGAAIALGLGPLGPHTSMGVAPEHRSGIHIGRDTTSTTCFSVRMRWGHRGWWVYCPRLSAARPPPLERLLGLGGIGLGLAKILFGPSPLSNPFPKDPHLRKVHPAAQVSPAPECGLPATVPFRHPSYGHPHRGGTPLLKIGSQALYQRTPRR